MRRPGVLFAAAIASVVLSLSACSSPDGERTIDVYAASSLTEAFSILEERFEADHPGVDVRLNLAGSNALLRQILDGGEADVYAPASVTLIDDLLGEIDGETRGTVYASNRLTLVVPVGDAAESVGGAEDLAGDDVLVARCATGVPCGDATDRYLDDAGLTLGRSTDEANVRAVLLKVASGEVDAGFVYTTDARARAADVNELPLDEAPNVDLGVVVLSEDADSLAFGQYVLSDDAADVLRDLGFAVP